MAREGVPLNDNQRQLGRTKLGITSVCLPPIDNSEIDRDGRAPERRR